MVQELVSPDDCFKEIQVDENTDLTTIIQEQKANVKRSRAFYEFMRDEEDINKDREVVLKHIVSRYYDVRPLFQPLVVHCNKPLLTDKRAW